MVGRGGMGVVYRALHIPLNREVALKLIAPEWSADADFIERFKRESRVAASLDHPHAVPIYHASENDGLLYVTMRLVEGTDLRELIVARGKLRRRRSARSRSRSPARCRRRTTSGSSIATSSPRTS